MLIHINKFEIFYIWKKPKMKGNMVTRGRIFKQKSIAKKTPRNYGKAIELAKFSFKILSFLNLFINNCKK